MLFVCLKAIDIYMSVVRLSVGRILLVVMMICNRIAADIYWASVWDNFIAIKVSPHVACTASIVSDKNKQSSAIVRHISCPSNGRSYGTCSKYAAHVMNNAL